MSCQPGERNGKAFYDMTRPVLRDAVRHSALYEPVRQLSRSPLARQAADTVSKSAREHAEAFRIIGEWLEG